MYVGAGRIGYTHPDRDKDRECRPSKMSCFEYMEVTSEVMIQFPCNGVLRANWTFYVSYEPDDTFTVRLIGMQNGIPSLLAEYNDVYIDMLKHIVESTYDDAITKYCGGFIPC